MLLGCFLVTACSESTDPDRVTLPLISVDGRSLPTVLPAETGGTVEVVSGELVGDSDGPRCTWRIVFQPGGEFSGTFGNCVLNEGDIRNLVFDPGPPAAEVNYRFGE